MTPGDIAAWVQAFGTIAAVAGAAWVAAAESRASRKREERLGEEARERETHALVAAKTAALNLAILASTHIHDLHVLLRDEARRGRVARMSPSRTVLATESLLIAFPIQTLSEAAPMVAFAYFPGALATAAEIYANLEAAIRAAKHDARPAIYGEFAEQMAQLDSSTKRRLQELEVALGYAPEAASRRRAQMAKALASHPSPPPAVPSPARGPGPSRETVPAAR